MRVSIVRDIWGDNNEFTALHSELANLKHQDLKNRKEKDAIMDALKQLLDFCNRNHRFNH